MHSVPERRFLLPPRKSFHLILVTFIMVKLNISGNYLTIVSYQEFFAFSFDLDKLSWQFQKCVRCNDNVPKSDGPIECCAFSPCGKYFGMYFNKNIIIYSTSDWSKSYVCPGERKAASLQFFSTSRIVLLADKSGCASFYAFKNNELQKIELAFGHNSMLTSVLITDDEEFVITGDRDEKIRITKYPNVYNIEKYCLGHKMFVTCLGFLPADKRILISSSGDGTVRFWDFLSGHQLALYDCNAGTNADENSKAVITKFVSCKINQISILAVLKYRSNEIKIIDIQGDLGTGLKIKEVKVLHLKHIPWDIAFHCKTLVCLLPDQSNPVTLWSPELSEPKTNFDNIKSYLTENWDSFLSEMKKISDEIPILFKREVDNLQEYEQRKRARLLKTGKTS